MHKAIQSIFDDLIWIYITCVYKHPRVLGSGLRITQILRHRCCVIEDGLADGAGQEKEWFSALGQFTLALLPHIYIENQRQWSYLYTRFENLPHTGLSYSEW